MSTSLYTTHITLYSMVNGRYIHLCRCICYVEGCKFSTSTHVNYLIVSSIISAICGYFYGHRGPKIASEIAYIDQNPLKITKPRPAPPLVSGTRDIQHGNWMRRNSSNGPFKKVSLKKWRDPAKLATTSNGLRSLFFSGKLFL